MTDFASTHPVSDPSLFVGRQAAVESLQYDTISTVFIGEARIGKTSLLLHLKKELESIGKQRISRIPVYVNLRNPLFKEPRDLYQTIALYVIGQLKKAGEHHLPRVVQLSDPTSMLRFLGQLDTAGLRYEVVALIDNLDRPEAFLSQRLILYSGLRQILDFSPNGFTFKLVASAASGFLTLEQSITSKLLSRLQVVSLGALSLDESRRLMSNSPLFDSAVHAEILKDYLFDQCGGHPCLLQELLANVTRDGADSTNLSKILEREIEELGQRGGSFFQQYLRELAFEEGIYLLAIALQAGDQQWHPPQTVVSRFVSAGLVRETPSGLPEPSCKLFFQWFRQNVTKILPSLTKVSPVKADYDSLIELLQTKLRASIGDEKHLTERHLQDVVNTMLITVGFQVDREIAFTYKGKGYRVDFALPGLGLALELKLAKSARQVGPLIDELQADLDAYRSKFKYLLVLIYDTVGSKRFDAYIGSSEDPFVRHIVIRH